MDVDNDNNNNHNSIVDAYHTYTHTHTHTHTYVLTVTVHFGRNNDPTPFGVLGCDVMVIRRCCCCPSTRIQRLEWGASSGSGLAR